MDECIAPCTQLFLLKYVYHIGLVLDDRIGNAGVAADMIAMRRGAA